MASSPRTTKQERVYQTMRERILSGQYGPGYRVVIETLAEELGVSALPVREAIRRLEAEGLIVHRPNAGAQVAPADPGAFEDEMTVLAVLEGYATAAAAPLLGAARIRQLTSITDGMVRAMEQMDPLAFSQLNHDFHDLIYAACPNPSLVELVRTVGRRLDAIRRTVFVQIPYRANASVAEHRRIIDLIASGATPARIERAARAHKLATVESFRAWQRDHGPAGA